jgi:glycosyltransferase involved in cell wall biosynthesis
MSPKLIGKSVVFGNGNRLGVSNKAFVSQNIQAKIRVLFSCTGVGIFNRGIESFFRDSFDGLKDAMPGVEVRLLKGAEIGDGETLKTEKLKGEGTSPRPSPQGGEGEAESGMRKAEDRERVAWCLSRTGAPARWLGNLIRRNSYVAEQLSSFPAVVREIYRFRPHVIFYSDANLGFQLYRWRRQIGVPYRLLFSNGGPVRPPFTRTDFVHQVAPLYHAEALAAGESPAKHFMVPYGINVPEMPVADPVAKRIVRQKLGLPENRPILLSVGWIAREHKRMDYVIQEVAQLPTPRPFLQLLGAMDEKSPELIELGNRLLGSENFSARSVPYAQVGEFYRAADIFVLASLKEGFGRVYLEALMHGLPTIGHRHPVMEFVLGEVGVLGDLSQPGNLTDVLAVTLKQPNTETLRQRRWASVRDRFSWPVLAPQYQQMFEAVTLRLLP